MPIYEVEVYELYSSKRRIKAKNEAEAIARVMDGEGDMVDGPDMGGSLEYIETADSYGMDADAYSKDLQKYGVDVRDIIPGIRGIEETEWEEGEED